MLLLVEGLHLGPRRTQPVILLLEFVAEHGQGVAEILLVEDGHGRYAQQRKDGYDETLSFHTGMTFVVL